MGFQPFRGQTVTGAARRGRLPEPALQFRVLHGRHVLQDDEDPAVGVGGGDRAGDTGPAGPDVLDGDEEVGVGGQRGVQPHPAVSMGRQARPRCSRTHTRTAWSSRSARTGLSQPGVVGPVRGPLVGEPGPDQQPSLVGGQDRAQTAQRRAVEEGAVAVQAGGVPAGCGGAGERGEVGAGGRGDGVGGAEPDAVGGPAAQAASTEEASTSVSVPSPATGSTDRRRRCGGWASGSSQETPLNTLNPLAEVTVRPVAASTAPASRPSAAVAGSTRRSPRVWSASSGPSARSARVRSHDQWLDGAGRGRGGQRGERSGDDDRVVGVRRGELLGEQTGPGRDRHQGDAARGEHLPQVVGDHPAVPGAPVHGGHPSGGQLPLQPDCDPVQRLVGHRVVGLPPVAEESGHGREQHQVPQFGDAAQRVQDVAEAEQLGGQHPADLLRGLLRDQPVGEHSRPVHDAGDASGVRRQFPAYGRGVGDVDGQVLHTGPGGGQPVEVRGDLAARGDLPEPRLHLPGQRLAAALRHPPGDQPAQRRPVLPGGPLGFGCRPAAA
ncbi:hypothetical protein SGLAM104S_09183 [Streptomyces glaucescens]